MRLQVGSLVLGGAFVPAIFAGAFYMGRRSAPAPLPVELEHHIFYTGRPRVFVGDDKTEVEVFQDPTGTWVACVWKRGRCWRGKLQLRSGRE